MITKGLNVIVTGSTGMVGEGVLHICLEHTAVETVLVINRRPCGIVHRKLKEIIHDNFFDLSPIERQLTGFDACFFCLGVSSVGMKEPDYYNMTYTLTLAAAGVLVKMNPAMTFCYISGAGTDSSEKGRTMWARVKGKTENDLMKLPFKKAYGFRPGFMKPMKGMVRTLPYYKYIAWLYPIGRALSPNGFCELAELGKAMVYTAGQGYNKSVVEGNAIIELAKRSDGSWAKF